MRGIFAVFFVCLMAISQSSFANQVSDSYQAFVIGINKQLTQIAKQNPNLLKTDVILAVSFNEQGRFLGVKAIRGNVPAALLVKVRSELYRAPTHLFSSMTIKERMRTRSLKVFLRKAS